VTGGTDRTDGPTGVLAALRSGGWRRVATGPAWAPAALAALADVATTYVVLTSPEYVEFNATVAGAADVPTAMAYFVLLNAGYLSLATLDLGWLSTAAAAYLVAVMGVGGGLNNLVLFATGTAPVELVDGPLLVGTVIPVAGVGAAVTVARLVHGRLPRGEVAVALGLWLLGFALH